MSGAWKVSWLGSSTKMGWAKQGFDVSVCEKRVKRVKTAQWPVGRVNSHSSAIQAEDKPWIAWPQDGWGWGSPVRGSWRQGKACHRTVHAHEKQRQMGECGSHEQAGVAGSSSLPFFSLHEVACCRLRDDPGRKRGRNSGTWQYLITCREGGRAEHEGRVPTSIVQRFSHPRQEGRDGDCHHSLLGG